MSITEEEMTAFVDRLAVSLSTDAICKFITKEVDPKIHSSESTVKTLEQVSKFIDMLSEGTLRLQEMSEQGTTVEDRKRFVTEFVATKKAEVSFDA